MPQAQGDWWNQGVIPVEDLLAQSLIFQLDAAPVDDNDLAQGKTGLLFVDGVFTLYRNDEGTIKSLTLGEATE